MAMHTPIHVQRTLYFNTASGSPRARDAPPADRAASYAACSCAQCLEIVLLEALKQSSQCCGSDRGPLKYFSAGKRPIRNAHRNSTSFHRRSAPNSQRILKQYSQRLKSNRVTVSDCKADAIGFCCCRPTCCRARGPSCAMVHMRLVFLLYGMQAL